jgi:hypothetical protein
LNSFKKNNEPFDLIQSYIVKISLKISVKIDIGLVKISSQNLLEQALYHYVDRGGPESTTQRESVAAVLDLYSGLTLVD